jgi:gamma-glutamyltranspeptidase/glutathione hydrolase
MAPTGRSGAAVSGRAMVTTSQPLAAQAGLAALQRGGNAVDAALAAAITLTVVEPVSNGVGGDLFAQVWRPGAAAPLVLNASGRSPRAWTPGRFAGRATMPLTGWDSVTVPLAPAGWRRLWQRAGRLPFDELFSDAIRHAEQGFGVTPVVAAKWLREAERLREQPGFAAQFLPAGRAPRAGERFRPPHLAATLRELAASGCESFYRGALATALADAARRGGAALDAQDLQQAWDDPAWIEPLYLDVAGRRVFVPPPNGQGITLLQALGIAAQGGLADLRGDAAAAHHRAIEAVKLAFVDSYRALADPAAMTEDVQHWLQPARLAAQAARIDAQRAGDFGAALPPWGGTVYVAAADADGMLVSLIQSNFVGFGSGVVVPGTGIHLHDRGAGFTLQHGHPNAVGGAKRPLHTLVPALVARWDGGAWQPQAALGVTGGPIQPQGLLQLLLRLLPDADACPQAAVAAPRWKVEHRAGGPQLDLEPAVAAPLAAALRACGHAQGPPGITGDDFGGAFAIVREPAPAGAAARWRGGADPRRDGLVCAA